MIRYGVMALALLVSACASSNRAIDSADFAKRGEAYLDSFTYNSLPDGVRAGLPARTWKSERFAEKINYRVDVMKGDAVVATQVEEHRFQRDRNGLLRAKYTRWDASQVPVTTYALSYMGDIDLDYQTVAQGNNALAADVVYHTLAITRSDSTKGVQVDGTFGGRKQKDGLNRIYFECVPNGDPYPATKVYNILTGMARDSVCTEYSAAHEVRRSLRVAYIDIFDMYVLREMSTLTGRNVYRINSLAIGLWQEKDNR